MKIRNFLILLTILTLSSVNFVQAHLIPAGRGTVNVIGELVYVAISLPVEVFSSERESGKVELSTSQLNLIKTQFSKKVRFKSGDQNSVWQEVFITWPDGTHRHQDVGNEVIVMAIAKFEGKPKSLTLLSELRSDKSFSISVDATITEKGKTVKKETTILTNALGEIQFFNEQ